MFSEAVEYIKSLDMYGSVLSLDSIRLLAEELDNPQDGLKFIHVTGTNGKGSVTAYISNILKKAGYKVGTYNSPAVLSDIDQFKINMKTVSKSLFAEAVSLVRTACTKVEKDTGNHPTRFEVETMTAFVMFYLEKCDIVVLETGLGGISDATNIVTSTILHVFTSISMDHIGVIGNTIEEIAQNKSGIIKSSVPTVICVADKNSKTSAKVIRNKCNEMSSDVYEVNPSSIANVHIKKERLVFDICSDTIALKNVKIKMRGYYQPLNVLTAIMAIKVLIDIGYSISEANIYKGLKKTKIPFRFEHISLDKTEIILDGAHNADGADKFIKSLELNYPDREFIYITGIFKDKAYDKIAKITAPLASKIYAIQNMNSNRSLDKKTLCNEFSKYNKNVIISESIEEALDLAISEANNKVCANATHPVVCCFGSLSWLKQARKHIKSLKDK